MRDISTLPLLASIVTAGACGSCGGSQLPSSDRTPVPVTFTITNDTDATIYLASQDTCGFEALTIGDLRLGSGQTLSCERVQEARPCPSFGGCGGAGVRPLEAGASWTITWAGNRYESARVEPVGEGCPGDCVVSLAAEPGAYPVTVEAYGSCEGESCDCELPNDSASCHPDEPYEGPPDRKAEAQLTLPETASTPVAVELHFR